MADLKSTRMDREKREEEEWDEGDDIRVSMQEVDDYMALLYEDDMDERVRGAFMISKLAKHPANLPDLAHNRFSLSLSLHTSIFHLNVRVSIDCPTRTADGG